MNGPDPALAMARAPVAAPALDRVLELRQYTLHPGQRDVLIELFDRDLVEPQERAGMRVIGQFRDLDRPDHFVWLRGFGDMASRADALRAFYGGPVWRAHREAANATMIDSSDVLLLRPIGPGAGFPVAAGADAGTGAWVATICLCHAPVDGELRRWVERALRPALAEAGAPPVAVLETEPADNTFPALPVRAGDHALVWFSRFADDDAAREHLERLDALAAWAETVVPVLRTRMRSMQRLRLRPTAGSRLR
jgi:hypothetical protein